MIGSALLLALLHCCGALLAATLSASSAATDYPTFGVIIRASDASSPASPPMLSRVLFGKSNADSASVASFWRANSYGAINITGTVHPVVLVSAYPLSADRCYASMASEAESQLRAAGVDLARFKIFVVLQSGDRRCGGKGQGSPGRIVMNGTIAAGNIAHEFGHAFPNGLRHAGSVRCPSPGACAVNDYGYYPDIMGKGAYMGSSNVVHKLQLEVIDSSRYEAHAAPAGVPVEYTIKPLASPEGLLGVRLGGTGRLPPQFDSASWIEYRQPVGIDLTDKEWILRLLRGALVLRVGTVPGSRFGCHPCLVDTKPQTLDVYDSSVLPGESWVEAGHRIETLSATPQGVTVRVTKL